MRLVRTLLRLPTILALAVVPWLLLSAARDASAQELLDQIAGLGQANAEGYALPLSEGLVRALAGGYVDRSRPLEGLRFDLGIRFLGIRPGDERRSFTAAVPDTVGFSGQIFQQPYGSADGSLETPTIAGSGEGLILIPQGEFRSALAGSGLDPDDFRLVFPSGLDLPLAPNLAVQLTVGIGFGTEVAMRFLPAVEVLPEVGQLRSHGFSVHHHLSRWIPLPGLDLTGVAGFQEATAGEDIDVRAVHWGLIGGTRIGPVDLFGSAQLRSGSARIEYQVENPRGMPLLPPDGAAVSFRTSVSTEPTYLVGARLQLLVMNLAGHYSFGEQDGFSIKLGMGLP
ncbi:MAG: hypothetical protein EA422_01830 [Gemmatimonadales bacterium]|nr:MAG: hypothetical protein EA422_01830 [Gemmatimonadales bacterium]